MKFSERIAGRTTAGQIFEALSAARNQAEGLRATLAAAADERRKCLLDGTDAQIAAVEKRVDVAGRELDRLDVQISELERLHSETLAAESGSESEIAYRENVAKRLDAADRVDVALRDLAAAYEDYAAAGTALVALRQIGGFQISPTASLVHGRWTFIHAIAHASRHLAAALFGAGALPVALKSLGVSEREYWREFDANLESARKSMNGGSDV